MASAGDLTEDNFILVYDNWSNTLRQLNLADETVTRISLAHQRFISPAYDGVENDVYWYCYTDINRGKLNGTNGENILGEGYYDIVVCINH